MKYNEGEEFLVNAYDDRQTDQFLWYLEITGGDSRLDFNSRGDDVVVAYEVVFFGPEGEDVFSLSTVGNDFIDPLDEFDEQEPDNERPEFEAHCPACDNETLLRLLKGAPWRSTIDEDGSWHCTGCGFTFYESAMYDPSPELLHEVERAVRGDNPPEMLVEWHQNEIGVTSD